MTITVTHNITNTIDAIVNTQLSYVTIVTLTDKTVTPCAVRMALKKLEEVDGTTS